MKLARTSLAVLLALLLVACGNGGESGDNGAPDEGSGKDGGGTTAAKPIDPATTGKVMGTVRLEGDAPSPAPIDTSKDDNCHEEIFSETVRTGEGGTLRDVLIEVRKADLRGWELPGPSEPTARLDQKGCRFEPHLLAVQVGQTIEITNSDPTKHNVNFVSKTGRKNEQQDPGDPAIEVKTQVRDLFTAKCDIHAWMNTTVAVLDHPFFDVTGEDGTYELPPLPEGTYTIKVRHELCEGEPQEVTVKAGETATLDFTLKMP